MHRLFGPLEFVVLGCISGQPLLGLGGDPVLTEMVDMLRGMYLLVKLNQQLMKSIHQLRVSQVHSQNNPIVIDEPEDDVLDTALVQVPVQVQH